MARSPEEESVLQSLIGFAQTLLSRGQKDLGLALAAEPLAAVGSTELPRLLTGLPEESRTHFSGLMEALEIYQSVHGTLGSLLNLNEAAVAELRKIRDICLQGGTHAYY